MTGVYRPLGGDRVLPPQDSEVPGSRISLLAQRRDDARRRPNLQHLRRPRGANQTRATSQWPVGDVEGITQDRTGARDNRTEVVTASTLPARNPRPPVSAAVLAVAEPSPEPVRGPKLLSGCSPSGRREHFGTAGARSRPRRAVKAFPTVKRSRRASGISSAETGPWDHGNGPHLERLLRTVTRTSPRSRTCAFPREHSRKLLASLG